MAEGVDGFLRRRVSWGHVLVLGLGLLFGGEATEKASGYGFELRVINIRMMNWKLRGYSSSDGGRRFVREVR